MSKANRKAMYDYLVANNKLSQDDGALVKEFGEPLPPAKPEPVKETLNLVKPKRKK